MGKDIYTADDELDLSREWQNLAADREGFRAWLEERFPLKAAHVMARIHEMRGGRDNDPNFGTRMTGEGLFAQLLSQRFQKAKVRFGLDRDDVFDLDTSLFVPPSPLGQARLF